MADAARAAEEALSHADEVAKAARAVQRLGETVGEAAPQVVRRLYDQGLFRGIRSADEWSDILSGVRQGADLDVHHLIERRFARDVFGLDPGDVPAVVLDRTFHQKEVTARLCRQGNLPPGGSYSLQKIWNTYMKVYSVELGRQDWLEVIWPYFARLGVQR